MSVFSRKKYSFSVISIKISQVCKVCVSVIKMSWKHENTYMHPKKERITNKNGTNQGSNVNLLFMNNYTNYNK